MTWAADAAGDPDPQALAASGCSFVARYVGTAHQRYGVTRRYIDACHAAGVGVGLIFEEWGSQFLGGYQAAVESCARMTAGWDALGAPRDGTVIPMVVILDPSPGAAYGNEGALREFARGWNDALPFSQFTGYGSRYALDLAAQVAPKMTRRWGVGTWGYGERADGTLPPDVGADMIQHGNRGAPVPGCDYNTLLRPDMGQWGGNAATRQPSGQDIVDAAATFLGQPYSTAPGRDDPASGHKDCSGLVVAAYKVVTGDSLGATVSSSIFHLCVSLGLGISREEAFATPGALLLKPENPLDGIGPLGHIAISDGRGGTVEATPPRVQRLPLSYNAPWSSQACLLPGIDYGGASVVASSTGGAPDMVVGFAIFQDKVFAYLLNDQGKVVREFPQPAGPNDGGFGFSGDALMVADKHGRFRLTPEEWTSITKTGALPAYVPAG